MSLTSRRALIAKPNDPIEVWEHPVPEPAAGEALVPPEQLRWLLLADVERTVNKDGVHFEGLRFIAGELNGLVGEKVQVRYTAHELRQIEIADYLHDYFEPTARAIDGLEKALAGLGLLDQALALDLRKPRTTSTGFRAVDLATAGQQNRGDGPECAEAEETCA